MPALGDEFRAAREARHLSLSDVSEQIHIRSVYLESIENEDWSAIAAPVYVRGFVRTYARFLGLDPDLAVQQYNAAIGDSGSSSPAAASRSVSVTRSPGVARTFEEPLRRPSLWVWVAGAAALLLVAYVTWSYIVFQNGGGKSATATADTTPAAAASPAESPGSAPSNAPRAAAASAPGGHVLVVRISQASWLKVDVDGKPQVEGTFQAGTEKSFRGKMVALRAGNAAGVDVTVNGKDLGPLGASGDVVDRTFNLTQE
jgi:cytoskeletal protein RodZ